MRHQISEEKIRIRMLQAGIQSLAELSRRSEVSRPKIYELFSDKMPYQLSFIKIANALGVEPEDLLIDSGTKEEAK